MAEPEKPVRATVIVGGIPHEETLDGSETIRQIISEMLPDDQKANADSYDLATKDGPPLDPASILEDDNIPNGAVLVITKKDGGGGACGGP